MEEAGEEVDQMVVEEGQEEVVQVEEGSKAEGRMVSWSRTKASESSHIITTLTGGGNPCGYGTGGGGGRTTLGSGGGARPSGGGGR
jgi:hypothetical protein